MSDYYDELLLAINELQSLIKQYKKKENIEIEIRLGQIQFNSFKPGLASKDFYDKIKSILDESDCWDKKINNKSEELCVNGIKRMTLFNNKKILKHQSIKKEKIKNVNIKFNGTPYDIRLSVAKEIPVEDKIKNGTGILRKKNRMSYYYKDYRIDLTEVEQIENSVSNLNYELEVEFINLDNDKISDKYRAHSGLLLIRDMINMCEKIEDCKLEIDNEINKLSEDIDKMNIN